MRLIRKVGYEQPEHPIWSRVGDTARADQLMAVKQFWQGYMNTNP